MNFDLRKAGRILMIVNFVFTAGVVAVGADFLSTTPVQTVDERVFREIVPPPKAPTASKTPKDYSGVSGAKFRTRGESGRKGIRDARPGAASALERSLRVLGIMLSNNQAFNCAIVEEILTRKQYTVFVGDVVGSVEVVAIRAEEVEVLMHGEKTVLELDLTVSVPERKRSLRSGKLSKRRNRVPPGKPDARKRLEEMKRAMESGGSAGPGGSKRDEVASHLEKMSPALVKWWKNLPQNERSRWEKWWLNRSPEDRKKWEKKFTQLAESKKNKMKGIK